MAIKPVTVTQLNDYIGRVINTDPILGNIKVIGEISNLKYHQSGHVYFSIVDSASKINCFLQKEYADNLHYVLDNGMEVTVIGSVNVYKKNGTYSIFIKDVEVSGAGNLSIAFEKLKNKLLKEGLFDKEHKKPIPKFPNKIAIITSETGAAIKDILKILKSRNSLVDVIIFPVLVQGDGAAKDISSMIDYVNENYNDIDTIIVGRGGGSADDLWAFNEEIVARNILNSKIPIISAVGHEIDFTISDMVSDLRAETPTAAATLAVFDENEIKEKIDRLRKELLLSLENKVSYFNLLIDNNLNILKVTLKDKIESCQNKLNQLNLILQENNPEKILNMGYSTTSDLKGNLITSIKNLILEGEYIITLKDGSALCKITSIESEKIGSEQDGK